MPLRGIGSSDASRAGVVPRTLAGAVSAYVFTFT